MSATRVLKQQCLSTSNWVILVVMLRCHVSLIKASCESLNRWFLDQFQLNSICRRSKLIARTSTTSQRLRTEVKPRNQRDFILHAASSHFLYWASSAWFALFSPDCRVRTPSCGNFWFHRLIAHAFCRMLATICWCNYSDCHSNANCVSSC